MFWLAAAGAALMAGSTVMKWNQMNDSAQATVESSAVNAALQEFEGDMAYQASLLEAQKIRADAIRVRGRQMTQIAANGIVIGDGSAQALVDETLKLSEQDAYEALYEGSRKRSAAHFNAQKTLETGLAEARQIKSEGTSSLLSSVGSSLLSAGLK